MSFEYTETYRSGHNGADSKSVREQSPASSNLAVSASVVADYVSFVTTFFIILNEKLSLAHAVAPPFFQALRSEIPCSRLLIFICILDAAVLMEQDVLPLVMKENSLF